MSNEHNQDAPEQNNHLTMGDEELTAKYCQECGRMRPIAQFYRISLSNTRQRYKNGFRYSALCREHHDAAVREREKQLKPGDVGYEKRKQRQSAYRKTERGRLSNIRSTTNYREKVGPEQRSEEYQKWAAENKPTRRASQAAWYQRKKEERERLKALGIEPPKASRKGVGGRPRKQSETA